MRVIKVDTERRRIGLSLRKVDSMAYANMDYEMMLSGEAKTETNLPEEPPAEEEMPEPVEESAGDVVPAPEEKPASEEISLPEEELANELGSLPDDEPNSKPTDEEESNQSDNQ